jgi:acyl dehydratase
MKSSAKGELVLFSELVIGSEFVGAGRTLTESDLSISCMISGDWHPIHSDETYAKRRGLPGRLFQGSFGILIATGMATLLPHFSDDIVGATGIREWTYRAPIVVGDTVHVRSIILSKRVTSDGERAIIERTLSLINQSDTVVQQGIAGTMVRLKSG